jgi:hypothetical protein
LVPWSAQAVDAPTETGAHTIELRPLETKTIDLHLGSATGYDPPFDVALEVPETVSVEGFEAGFVPFDHPKTPPVTTLPIPETEGRRVLLRLSFAECSGTESFPLTVIVRAVHTYRLALRIQPEGCSWTTYRRSLAFLPTLIVGVLLWLYLRNMLIANVSWIPRDRLAQQLVPLVHKDGGVIEADGDRDIRARLHRSLSPWVRFKAWLRANPLRFGLPGGSYRETLRINLSPTTPEVSAGPIVAPDLKPWVLSHPDRAQGALLATPSAVRESARFHLVPDSRGRVENLFPDPPLPETETSPLDLRFDQDLRRSPSNPRDGDLVGWRLRTR